MQLVKGLLRISACACVMLFVSPHGQAALPERVTGSYDLLICNGACALSNPTNAIFKGRVFLFAHHLKKWDLQRFDESLLLHHHGEPINGCFDLESVGEPRGDMVVDKIGVTSWSTKGGVVRFSLFYSVDAGYAVELKKTKTGLAGRGTYWGAGVAAPKEPRSETVVARYTGRADIGLCTFFQDAKTK